MKKKILNVLLIIAMLGTSLFVLTACGGKKEENKIDENTAEGTVQAFFDAVSKGDIDRAEGYINMEAFMAIQIVEDINISLEEACNVVSDFGKGADYVKEHHKDFAEGWKNLEVGDLDDEKVKTLDTTLTNVKETIRRAIEQLSEYSDIKIKNIEKKDEPNASYSVEGISTFGVTVTYKEDEDEKEEKMDITVIEIGGKNYILDFE